MSAPKKRRNLKYLKGCKPGCLPTDYIRPHVERYLKQQPPHDAAGGLGPITRLCLRAKVNPKRLGDIVSGRSKCIDFDIADRLFCAMGLTHLWYKPGTMLARVYQGIDLSVSSRSKPWEPEIGYQTCEECRNDFTFVVELAHSKDGSRRFCSLQCQGRATAKLGGEAKGRAMRGKGLEGRRRGLAR